MIGKRAAILALPVLLSACGGADWAAVIEALSKDPNSICVSITTLYGSAQFDRNHGCSGVSASTIKVP